MTPASAQGLRGMPPDDFRGSWEDYQNRERRSLETTRAEQLPATFLHAAGLSWLANDDQYAASLMREADSLYVLNRDAEADACYRKAIGIVKDPEKLFTYQHFYANFLGYCNRSKEENELLRKSLKMQEQYYGKDSKDLCGDMMYLADNVSGRSGDDCSESIQLYRRCLEIWSRGSYDFDQVIATQRLAFCLEREGKIQDAEKQFINALHLMDEHDSGSSFLLEQLSTWPISTFGTNASQKQSLC